MNIGGAALIDENDYPFKIEAAALIYEIKNPFDKGAAALIGEIENPFKIGAAALIYEIKNPFDKGAAALIGEKQKYKARINHHCSKIIPSPPRG